MIDARKQFRNKRALSDDIVDDMADSVKRMMKLLTQPAGYMVITFTPEGEFIMAYNLESLEENGLLEEDELPLDFILDCVKTEIDELIVEEAAKLL